jgi:hypothetical protein
MVLVSPVCHLHYFSLAIPLVLGVQAAAWSGDTYPRWDKARFLVALANAVANILPRCPGMQLVRDGGLAMYATLLLWLVGMLVLCTRPQGQPADEQPSISGLAA